MARDTAAMLSGTAWLLALWLGALPALAADSSATERLMRVADCIRDAGDLKGAPREAFMNKCLGSDAGLVAGGKPRKAAPSAEPVLPAVPVAPVAAPVGDGLPPQERILGCATASKGMQGEARAAFLKACLAGHIQSPAIDAEQARRRAACASQAHGQASADEHEAFIAACMGSAGGAPPPVAGDVAKGGKPRDESESRRRAACNVMARDQQGAARQAFIDACIAARPAAARPAPVAAASTSLSTRERLVRSKRCADEVRARTVESGQVLAYVNACMARP